MDHQKVPERRRRVKRERKSQRHQVEKPNMQRFCVMCHSHSDGLSNVSRFFLEAGLNLSQQVTRSQGSRSYGVYDVNCTSSSAKTIKREIIQVEGIISCEIGHFGRNPETERICIVHRNKTGTIAGVHEVICSKGYNVISQTTQTRGKFGFTVMDIETKEGQHLKKKLTFEEICDKISSLYLVISCDLKTFSPGSLHPLKLLEESSISDRLSDGSDVQNESNNEGNESGYETEDEAEKMERGNSTISKMRRYSRPRGAQTSFCAPHGSNINLSDVVGALKEVEICQNYYEGAQNKTDTKVERKGAMKERSDLTYSQSRKLVIALVGLPCRGKSFTGRKLHQFLNWKGIRTKIFNAGKYRRDENLLHGKAQADFFNPDNEAGSSAREQAAVHALNDLVKYLKEETGDVGIFDATNSVKKRRREIIERCHGAANVVFIEVICDDPDLLQENYLIKIRNSPDFAGMTADQAMRDLKARVKNYEDVYETVQENENVSFIKMFNISSKVLMQGVYGRMTRSVVPYLSALHVGSRSVVLVRAGLGKSVSSAKRFRYVPSGASEISPLGERGKKFAKRLSLWLKTMLFMRETNDDVPSFNSTSGNESSGDDVNETKVMKEMFRTLSGIRDFENEYQNPTEHTRPRTASSEKVRLDGGAVNIQGEIKVMTSTLPRAIETATIAIDSLGSQNHVEPTPMLNPINKGKFFNISNDELKAKQPAFWKKFCQNPFDARFPGGESYRDMVTKLEPVIVDIEQQTAPVVIVAHISTLQMLLAYFKQISVSEAVSIEFPMHSVVELQPLAGGSWKETLYDLEK